MESTFAINALVSMAAEEVTLSLDQVGWKASTTVLVKVAQ
jgi:hypothetical protein